jgi:hypothetical protein
MPDPHTYNRIVNGLKARGKKHVEILTLLQFDWPVSRFVLEKLSEHISDHIIADEQPVIYEIIEQALVSYSEAVHHGSQKKMSDAARFAVFMESLITETSRTMEIEIRDEQGSGWTIDSGVSFNEWYSSRSGEISIYPKLHANEKSLRSTLYELLTSETIRNVLRRIDYEDAVVDGRLGFRS